jgi:hypothetical protein
MKWLSLATVALLAAPGCSKESEPRERRQPEAGPVAGETVAGETEDGADAAGRAVRETPDGDEIQPVRGREDAGGAAREGRPIARPPTVFEEEPPPDEVAAPRDLPPSAADTAGETVAPPETAEGTPIRAQEVVDAGPRADAPEPPPEEGEEEEGGEEEEPEPIPLPEAVDGGTDATVIDEPIGPEPILDAGVPIPSPE